MRFESHLGHSVFPPQGPFWASECAHKTSFCVHTKPRILAKASIWERKKSDGSTSFTVRWRNPETRKQEGITFSTASEAKTLKRLLDANHQSFEIAQHAMVKSQTKAPTVAAVIQEHIDLLGRPSVGTAVILRYRKDNPCRGVQLRLVRRPGTMQGSRLTPSSG
ncbi:hypothetical protein GCM10017710_26550 [Arthrobacter ramosus]